MPIKQIKIYMNHHLAGVAAGIDALEHLEKAEKGTPMARVLTELRVESTADRAVLEDLMARLRIPRATAWIGGKMLRMRLPIGEGDSGSLHLLEALESISLGIEAKRALWIALAAVAQETPELRGPDYDLLLARAEQQRQRVEKLQVEAAQKALRHAA